MFLNHTTCNCASHKDGNASSLGISQRGSCNFNARVMLFQSQDDNLQLGHR